MSLSDFSVARPVSVAMIILIIVVLGLVSALGIGLDLMPELDYPTLSVVTRYEGAASEDIERLVSRPVEGAVAAVNRVTSVQSISQEDASVVLIEFAWGTDLDAAAADLREAIGLIDALLPQEAEDPLVVKFSLSAIPVLGYGVTGMGGDTVALRRFLNDNVVARLERLDGVAQAVLMGGAVQEVQVDVDRAALEASGLSLSQVGQAIGSQNLDLPAGRVVEQGEEYLLRTLGAFTTLQQVADTPVGIGSTGAPLRVSDIAGVQIGEEDVRNLARVNEGDSVFIMLNKQSGANPLQVAQRIKAEVDDIKAELGDQLEFALIMDTGAQIENMASNVSKSGLIGGLFAVLFMFLFLRSGRPTFAIAVAIPLSLLATFIPIYATGETLNLMTMGGLMLGIGMLVDNAIVVIENIFRHLEDGKGRKEAARAGAREVGMAITASTLTTLAVFLPLFFGGGIAGQLVRGLAMVVAFALAASLLVALTMVPMLASILFNANSVKSQETAWFAGIRTRYERVLAYALANRWKSLGGVAALVLASLALTPTLGADFMPGSDQPLIMGKVRFPVGTPLEVTDRAVTRVERIVQDVQGIQSVGVNIGVNEDDVGAAVSGMNPAGVHEAQFFIRLEDERSISQTEVLASLREVVPPVDDVAIEWMDMGEAFMSGGATKPIEVKVFGDDFQQLQGITERIAQAMGTVEGLVDIDTSLREVKPEQHLVIDRERATSYGLTAAEIARAVETASLGRVVGLYRDGGEEYLIRLRYASADRDRISLLDQVLVPSRSAGQVPLSQVASFEAGWGPVQITREQQSRRVSVQSNFADRSLSEVVGDIEDVLVEVRAALPSGYQIEFGGSYEQMIEAFMALLAAFFLAILLVYMVMASQFENFLQPLVIMVSVPLSLVGVITVLVLTGTPISAVTFVGVIMLAGIVVNNGIVLIDYINQQRQAGMSRREAVQRGGSVRLRAVLITSGTTITALLPMALLPGKGAELTGDMAITVAGGLAASTVLTLLVLPVLYELVDDIGSWFQRRLLKVVHNEDLEDPSVGSPVAPAGPAPSTVAGGLLLGLCLLVAPPPSVEASQPLTLSQAVDEALRANPGLLAAAEGEVQARIQRARAFSLLQPQVSVGMQYRINDREIAVDFSEGFEDMGLEDAFSGLFENLGLIYGSLFEAGLLDADDCDAIAAANGFADCAELTSALVDGGDLTPDTSGSGTAEPIVVQPRSQLFVNAQVQWGPSLRVIPLAAAGRHQITAAGQQVAQVRNQLILAVVRSFAAAYQTAEGSRLLRDQQEVVAAHVARVEALIAAGVVTEDAAMRARLEQARVLRQLRRAEAGEAAARRALALAMGRSEADIQAVAELPVLSGGALEVAGEGASSRPDVLAAQAMARASKQLRTDAALQFLPQLGVTGSLSWSDQAAGFDDRRTSWYIGLGVQLPIWDAGLTLATVRERASQHRQAEQQLRMVERQAAAELADARSSWELSRDALPLAEQERDLARELLRLVQARFDAGTATQLEILDARAALQASELSLLGAQVDAQVAAAQLLLSSGPTQGQLASAGLL